MFIRSELKRSREGHDSYPESSVNDFQQRLSEDDLIAGLRQYIRKNKALPEFYAQLDASKDNKMLSALISAIEKGEYESEAFSHPDCDYAILYAVERKLVPFWVGMTALTYVTALAQFTYQQSLKSCDRDVKSIRAMKVDRLIENGKFSVFACEYLDSLNDFLRTYGAKTDHNGVREAIANLPCFEQCLIRIEKLPYNEESHSEVDRLLGILLANMPFCDGLDGKSIVIPSYSLINIILQQFSEYPLQMKPVLGSLSNVERDRLHAKDQHPVALYCHGVISNVRSVHTFRAGPIPVWLHDIGHTLWGVILGFEQRKFLSQYFLLLIDEAVALRNASGNEIKFLGNKVPVVNSLKNLRDHLTDYDLSPIQQYMSSNIRFTHYMRKCIQKVLPQTDNNMRDFEYAINFAIDRMRVHMVRPSGLDADYIDAQIRVFRAVLNEVIGDVMRRNNVILVFAKKQFPRPIFSVIQQSNSAQSAVQKSDGAHEEGRNLHNDAPKAETRSGFSFK